MTEKKDTSYNIKVRKRPSSNQVNAKKDFDKVYTNYQSWVYSHPWYKTPFHRFKNRKITMYIIIILLLSYLIYLSEQEKKETKNLAPVEQVD